MKKSIRPPFLWFAVILWATIMTVPAGALAYSTAYSQVLLDWDSLNIDLSAGLSWVNGEPEYDDQILSDWNSSGSAQNNSGESVIQSDEVANDNASVSVTGTGGEAWTPGQLFENHYIGAEANANPQSSGLQSSTSMTSWYTNVAGMPPETLEELINAQAGIVNFLIYADPDTVDHSISLSLDYYMSLDLSTYGPGDWASGKASLFLGAQLYEVAYSEYGFWYSTGLVYAPDITHDFSIEETVSNGDSLFTEIGTGLSNDSGLPEEALQVNFNLSDSGTSGYYAVQLFSAIGDAEASAYSQTPIPEPGTLLLLSTGLAGLIGAHRRKRSK